MLKRLFGTVALAALLSLPAAGLVSAPAGAQENPVLATVNGKEITASDVAFALSTIGDALQRVPAAQRPQMVLDLMIDMELLADAAEKAGYADDPVLSQRIEYYRTQTLRDLYMEKVVEDKVTEEAVRARYESEAAEIEPQTEVSARHILVAEEEKAKELIAALKLGGDFAKLAEENSIDPGSARRGGSLGFFGRGQMVPAFEEAAFTLDEGAITEEPVQSRFGYHIIKVDERRTQPVPSFEEVGDRIRQLMIREAFIAEVERLKETAEIERTQPPQ
ncbi:MAG: peptidylprolyl isomerase [Pseudomonadota bacterium]